jgi:hypothetical protein
MANSSTTTLKIQVNANTHEIDKTRAKLAKLVAQASTSNNAYAKVLDNRVQYFKEHFDKIDKLTQKAGKALKSGIALASKATALEIAGMGVSMLGVHAAFAAGGLLIKAYRGGLQLLATGATAAGVAISSVAAAMREQAAAMSAFRYGPTELGKGIDTATAALRGLQTDSHLAFLGIKNLNAAFQAVNEHSKFDAGSQKLLKNLMDFGAASGNIEGSVKQAGDLVGLLQQIRDPKTGMAISFMQIKNAANALSPQLSVALKKLRITTKKGFMEALSSGELAKAGGVEGQLDTVGGTLINQLKGFKTQLMNLFADLGQPFLAPLKEGAQKMFNIFSRAIRALSGAIGGFGLTKMIDGLVKISDKLSGFIVNLVLKYLPQADGMFGRLGIWWEKTKGFFKNAADRLRPLIEGAKVIEHAFGAMFSPIKEAIASRFGGFNTFLQDNADKIKELGDKVGKFIASVLGVVHEFGTIYQNLLPFIIKLVDGATSVANSFKSVLHVIQSIGKLAGGGEGGSLFALLGLSATSKAMMGTKGGYLRMNKSNPAFRTLNPLGIGAGGPGGMSGPTGGPGGIYGSSFQGLQASAQSATVAINGLASAANGAAIASKGASGSGSKKSTPGQWSMRAINQGTGGYLQNKGILPTNFNVGQSSSLTPWGKKVGKFTGSMNNKFASQALHRGLMQFSDITPDELADIEMRKQRNPTNWAQKAAGSGKFGKSYYNARGNIQSARSGIRNARERSSVSGVSKALNSGGGSLGMSLGLGLLSQHVGKESQGAFGMGAMVAGSNPLAGAAIAGLGGAMGSRTSGGGALLGAGGGAAMGMMVAGPAGAAVGAALGAIGGAIMGWKNGNERRKKAAREAVVSEMGNLIYGSINSAAIQMKNGTAYGEKGITNAFSSAKSKASALSDYVNSKKQSGASSAEILQSLYKDQGKLGIKMSSSQLNDQLKASTTSVNKIGTQASAQANVSDMLSAAFTDKMAALRAATGKTSKEIIDLAKSMNYNLTDASKGSKDAMEGLGLAQLKTAAEYNAALTNSYTDATKVFETINPSKKNMNNINNIGRNYAERTRTGGNSKEDIGKTLTDLSTQTLSSYGGNATRASAAMLELYGKGGTAYKQKNGYFSGQENTVFGKDTHAAQYFGGLKSGVVSSIQSQLVGAAGQQGQQFSDIGGLNKVLQNLDPAALKKLSDSAANGFTDANGNAADFTTPEGIAKILGNAGIVTQTQLNSGQINVNNLTKDEKQVFDTFTAGMDNVFKQTWDKKPDWYTADSFKQLIDATKSGDTSTPRGDTTTSRLSQTMARHASVDGQLTGKRTVTSGYRTTDLGSINSDHVTGRALDLTGQNLGQYATMIQNTGGFAEFHGVGGERHLHVVPGSGAIGDSSSPAVVSSSIGRSGSSNNYYFTISGGGADPEAIANRVMAKIESVQRSKNERR